eukprot:NODE_1064_length_2626_cov_5.997999.p1 GENE.NODE_1064_length_2626_cov_5.997999~~NODE_1064_length_2626_cov_5.997999.p1  ORF type:complete len:712 (-),score=201.68 NODE_1064_length_2626_cov_5.997999:245-2380(-)
MRVIQKLTELYAHTVQHKSAFAQSHSRPDSHLLTNLLAGKVKIDKTTVPWNFFLCALIEPPSEMPDSIQQRLRELYDVFFGPDLSTLIAELAHVSLEDMRGVTRSTAMVFSESIMMLVILFSGIVAGMQTYIEMEEWRGWLLIDIVLCCIFVLDMAVRICRSGCRAFFRGPDVSWNVFDSVIVFFALFDIMMTTHTDLTNAGTSQLTTLRIVRIGRLARFMRFARHRRFKQLNLMVKGLFGGINTLFWAMVLLFFFIYVVAVTMTMLLGRTDGRKIRGDAFEDELHRCFSTLGLSIFTVFRCFTGDCTTSDGQPLAWMLADAYGLGFAMPYIFMVMGITFGLFNLIMAIYVENTLMVAKASESSHAVQKEEMIWTACAIRRFILRICSVQRAANALALASVELDVEDERDSPDCAIQITRRTFAEIIKDKSVEAMFDDMGIQSERSCLFDVWDADNSGTLGLGEIVHGLLRVRGEAQRSDVLTTVLGLRALIDMLRSQAEQLAALPGAVHMLVKDNCSKVASSRDVETWPAQGNHEEAQFLPPTPQDSHPCETLLGFCSIGQDEPPSSATPSSRAPEDDTTCFRGLAFANGVRPSCWRSSLKQLRSDRVWLSLATPSMEQLVKETGDNIEAHASTAAAGFEFGATAPRARIVEIGEHVPRGGSNEPMAPPSPSPSSPTPSTCVWPPPPTTAEAEYWQTAAGAKKLQAETCK